LLTKTAKQLARCVGKARQRWANGGSTKTSRGANKSGDNVGLCRMDLPGPTTSVGTRTDYSVGPWDYPTCAAWYLMA
jgi:hypothetical protein